MSQSAREEEADRVELVYYWALQQIANGAIADARDLYEQVPSTTAALTASGWLREVLESIAGWRALARELAIAYYRLVRALRTGATIADPGRDETPGESVSLEQLRDEFEAVVDMIDPAPPVDNQPVEPEPQYEDEDFEDDEPIDIEELEDFDDILEEQEDAATQEAADVLDRLGISTFVDKLEDTDPDNVVDLWEKHRNRQAAAAARISMNAARGLAYSLAETDLRAIGWVRYSKTGTPCGWCAMQISRGVAFKTRQSAELRGINSEFDQYHDNCRCVAVPVFSTEQYENSPLFDLNREMDALWQSTIKGKFGGKAALTEWRKIIRQRNETNSAVPEAA